ncbi:hypothetical protein ACM40_19110 [Chryseobacterium sp. BLS98]|jgi:hypothetical protein|uniref:hypothetical protein n=1 Tax=Chryseobacterium sp. BLS98 TaxID=885586 RepID=UPI00065ACF22|nr:hypothetical protein [Chryseobacterium sp. BLS98]KMQ59057.1 hypothetical protein ACM40_19110 [Chryseobacterium sp. BLS98]
MRKLVPALVILILASCKEEPQKETYTPVSNKISEVPKTEIVKDAIYSEFKPENITGLKIKGFDVEKAFSVGENKIVTGSYPFIDGKATLPDTEKDWGNRLLMLNNKNEIIYTSKGSGETYLYEPYFYKNNQNGHIIIVCQQAFEYFFGGEAFLLEKGKIKYLGNLDIEPNDERKKLTDILRIQESNKEINFTFDADSLVLKPGNEDIVIRNNNAKYIYDQHSLTFHQ